MSNPATVIGAQTHIKGNLEGDEDLMVVGRVDGKINLSRTLTVDPDGVVVADIQVQRAIISGTVVGNISASDVVHITEQGRVVGDLSAPRVVLVEGASFRGNIDMGDMDAPARPASIAAPRRTRTPVRPARPAEPEAPRQEAPAPKPAPPPRKVVRQATAPTVRPAPPRAAEDSLDKRAEAAARAVAKSTPRPSDSSKSKSKKKAPKPPTTAGKRTRARRK